MRDMRDALGALGPVDGRNPELNNLTVSLTLADEGDIVFLTSDGISDNFDPVVGKFALAKKVGAGADDRTREKSSGHRGTSASVKRSASHRIASANEKVNIRILRRCPLRIAQIKFECFSETSNGYMIRAFCESVRVAS